MALLENDIRIGSISAPTHRYNNSVIESGSAVSETMVDVIGNELSIDNFSLIVRYASPRDVIYAPVGYEAYMTTEGKLYGCGKMFVSLYSPWGVDGYKTSDGKVYSLANGTARDYLTDLVFGTPIWWYCGSGFFVKGYVSSVERVGKNAWKIHCVSGIGLLAEKMHGGGLYNGETVAALVSSIVGGSFRYSIANDVASITVYGHLPYDTARNNLHRVLFSCGAIVKRGTQYNDYTIGFPDTTTTDIPSSRIAMGGSVNYQLPSNTVEVTEHSFFKTPNDQTVALFDNSASVVAENLLVKFSNAPVYDLQTTAGLTIKESGVNYAVVDGYGILSGKPYAHVQHLVRISEKGDNEPERLKRVSNNELISSVNSANVAKRILNYYKLAKTVKAKIMLTNENCGAMVSTTDAFGDSITAIIRKMSIRPTTVKGADCELVSDYVPGNYGNNYQRRAVISASGTWTVPNDVSQIRIVLIGGGHGGHGGNGGECGYGGSDALTYYRNEGTAPSGNVYVDRGWYYSSQSTAHGGDGSYGGGGGKVAIYDKSVSPGEVVTATVGVGGVGGAGGVGGNNNRAIEPTDGQAGTNGTDTVVSSASIGTLSSTNGIVGNGYYDAITGEAYALNGGSGTRGGDGGQTDVNTDDGDSGANGLPGSDCGANTGGAGGTGYIGAIGLVQNATASGGGGGGAAFGINGGAGKSYRNPGGEFNLYYADGGDGANAVKPSKPSYGCGGDGGHGGGAGGNGAGGAMNHDFWEYDDLIPGNGGKGGNGSDGGDGGDGAVIIYY